MVKVYGGDNLATISLINYLTTNSISYTYVDMTVLQNKEMYQFATVLPTIVVNNRSHSGYSTSAIAFIQSQLNNN